MRMDVRRCFAATGWRDNERSISDTVLGQQVPQHPCRRRSFVAKLAGLCDVLLVSLVIVKLATIFLGTSLSTRRCDALSRSRFRYVPSSSVLVLQAVLGNARRRPEPAEDVGRRWCVGVGGLLDAKLQAQPGCRRNSA
jgi:hypothetical protein